jgi:hypothetical protein
LKPFLSCKRNILTNCRGGGLVCSGVILRKKRDKMKTEKMKRVIISILRNIRENIRFFIVGASNLTLMSYAKLNNPASITLDYSGFFSGLTNGEFYYIKVNGKHIDLVGGGFVSALNKAMEIKKTLIEQGVEVNPLAYEDLLPQREQENSIGEGGGNIIRKPFKYGKEKANVTGTVVPIKDDEPGATIIRPKKILVLTANPKTTPRLRLDEEVREIDEGLRLSKYRDKFEIQSRWAVRLRDLRRALLDAEPQIVHFTGHGRDGGLLVEDELGMAVPISPEALAGLFALCSDQVECVILGTCYSEKQAAAIGSHIQYVIGMEKAIKDKTAIEFAVGFYDALAAGKSLEEAFEFGRNAILQEFPDQTEHLIPVLKKKKR